MQGLDRPTWFAGDLGDPWVISIASALPGETLRLHCPADLPDAWPVDVPAPFALVLHRQVLGATDAQRLARLKASCVRPPRVVVCVGPHVRAVDVDRWAKLVDVVIPEATARETVVRHAFGPPRHPVRPVGNRPRVAVVSANYELRNTLADACRAGGYAPEAWSDWPETASSVGIPSVWDVPVLEPSWPLKLARRAWTSPVVALLGFADRSSVTLARHHGASACLDLPCETADLIDALDRIEAARLPEFERAQAHTVPPAPMGLRGMGRLIGKP